MKTPATLDICRALLAFFRWRRRDDMLSSRSAGKLKQDQSIDLKTELQRLDPVTRKCDPRRKLRRIAGRA